VSLRKSADSVGYVLSDNVGME